MDTASSMSYVKVSIDCSNQAYKSSCTLRHIQHPAAWDFTCRWCVLARTAVVGRGTVRRPWAFAALQPRRRRQTRIIWVEDAWGACCVAAVVRGGGFLRTRWRTRIKGSTATCNDPNMTPHASLYKGGHHGTLSNSYEILNTVDDAASVVARRHCPPICLGGGSAGSSRLT